MVHFQLRHEFQQLRRDSPQVNIQLSLLLLDDRVGVSQESL